MAKQNKLYSVEYMQEGQPVRQDGVDIFDLPYDKFDEQNPLVVLGDVEMRAGKKQSWPDLRDVVIDGDFDCGQFKITPDTVLPMGFKTLVCLHSVNSLDQLVCKLPAAFLDQEEPVVVVRPRLFNDIIKYAREQSQGKLAPDTPDVLTSARQFMAMYPNVIVVDKDDTRILDDVLDEVDRIFRAATVTKAPVKKPKAAKKTVLTKDDNWFSTDEIIDQCMISSTELSGLTREQIARYVQQARNANPRIPTHDRVRPTDGVAVKCVSVDCIADVIARVIEIANINASKSNGKKKVASQAKPVASATVVTERVPTGVVEKVQDKAEGPQETKLVPVKIEKYICPNVFKEFKSVFGGDIPALLKHLREVEMVNVRPTEDRGADVYYLDANNELVTARTLKFKNQNCLTQGINNKTVSGPRLVWRTGILDDGTPVFVAVKFFTQHTGGKAGVFYKEFIRNLKKDKSPLLPNKYESLTAIIQQLEQSLAKNPIQDTDESKPADDVAAKVTPIVTPDPVHTVPVESKPDLIEYMPTRTSARPRIRRVVGAELACQGKKKILENMTDIERRTSIWKSIYELEKLYTQELSGCMWDLENILQQMMCESDTTIMMDLHKQMGTILQHKQQVEKSLQEVEEKLRTTIDRVREEMLYGKKM